MRRPLLVLVALAALAAPAQALAHSTLIQASPGFRERLASSPRAVVLRFDQAVQVAAGLDSRLLLPRKHRRPRGSRSAACLLQAALPRLPTGAYTVRWHALSGDGHVVSGVYTFGVRATAPPATEAYGSSGPTRTEDVVRWAYFLALALLVGGLGFRLLVLHRRPLSARAENRFYALTGLGAFATINVGIAAFILRAEDALQLPFGRLLYGDLTPIAHSRFGTAFIAMTLGFAVVSAFLFLAWLTDRTAFLWPAFLLGLGFASGLSLSGHSAADAGSSWKSQLADWAHLSAACLWIGGLIQLAFVVWPLLPDARRPAFLSFSRLATVCIGVLLSAGVYLEHPSPAPAQRLVDDRLRPDPAREDRARVGRPCLGRRAQAHRRAGGLARKHRPLRKAPAEPVGESMVGMAVLLAAAILVDAKPPPQPAPSQPAATSVPR